MIENFHNLCVDKYLKMSDLATLSALLHLLHVVLLRLHLPHATLLRLHHPHATLLHEEMRILLHQLLVLQIWLHLVLLYLVELLRVLHPLIQAQLLWLHPRIQAELLWLHNTEILLGLSRRRLGRNCSPHLPLLRSASTAHPHGSRLRHDGPRTSSRGLQDPAGLLHGPRARLLHRLLQDALLLQELWCSHVLHVGLLGTSTVGSTHASHWHCSAAHRSSHRSLLGTSHRSLLGVLGTRTSLLPAHLLIRRTHASPRRALLIRRHPAAHSQHTVTPRRTIIPPRAPDVHWVVVPAPGRRAHISALLRRPPT